MFVQKEMCKECRNKVYSNLYYTKTFAGNNIESDCGLWNKLQESMANNLGYIHCPGPIIAEFIFNLEMQIFNALPDNLHTSGKCWSEHRSRLNVRINFIPYADRFFINQDYIPEWCPNLVIKSGKGPINNQPKYYWETRDDIEKAFLIVRGMKKYAATIHSNGEWWTWNKDGSLQESGKSISTNLANPYEKSKIMAWESVKAHLKEREE